MAGWGGGEGAHDGATPSGGPSPRSSAPASPPRRRSAVRHRDRATARDLLVRHGLGDWSRTLAHTSMTSAANDASRGPRVSERVHSAAVSRHTLAGASRPARCSDSISISAWRASSGTAPGRARMPTMTEAAALRSPSPTSEAMTAAARPEPASLGAPSTSVPPLLRRLACAAPPTRCTAWRRDSGACCGRPVDTHARPPLPSSFVAAEDAPDGIIAYPVVRSSTPGASAPETCGRSVESPRT